MNTAPSGNNALRVVATVLIAVAALACLASAAVRARIALPFANPLAAERQLSDAVERGDLDAARTFFPAAVRLNPLNGTNLVLGSAVAADAGDAASAERLIRATGPLGWRNRSVQVTIARLSLALGDDGAAASRMDALVRTGFREPVMRDLVASLTASPSGQQVYVAQLRRSPEWRIEEIRQLRTLPEAEQPDRLALLVASDDPSLACDRLSTMIDYLIQHRKIPAAAALWRGRCGGDAVGIGIVDPGFDAATQDDPFGWRLRSTGDVSVSVGDGPSGLTGTALYARSQSGTRERIAEQTLLLAPGSHVLTGRFQSNINDALGVNVVCATGVRTLADGRVTIVGSTRFELPITVPQDCPVQRIDLLVEPRRGATDTRLWVDDLVVRPGA